MGNLQLLLIHLHFPRKKLKYEYDKKIHSHKLTHCVCVVTSDAITSEIILSSPDSLIHFQEPNQF